METFVPADLSSVTVNVYAVMALSGQFYDKNCRLTSEITKARLFTELNKVRTFATKLVKHRKQPIPFILTFTGALANMQHDSFRPKPKKK